MSVLNLNRVIGSVLGGGLVVLALQGCGTPRADGGAVEPSAEAGLEGLSGLTDAEQAQLRLGKTWYDVTCLACHQADGLGQAAFAPPFDAQWLARPEGHLIRMVLQGLRGPIQVGDRVYELEMPALGVLDDSQVAAALSYVRWRWGKLEAWAVAPATVKVVRGATEEREEPWTVEALDKLGAE